MDPVKKKPGPTQPIPVTQAGDVTSASAPDAAAAVYRSVLNGTLHLMAPVFGSVVQLLCPSSSLPITGLFRTYP